MLIKIINEILKIVDGNNDCIKAIFWILKLTYYINFITVLPEDSWKNLQRFI